MKQAVHGNEVHSDTLTRLGKCDHRPLDKVIGGHVEYFDFEIWKCGVYFLSI